MTSPARMVSPLWTLIDASWPPTSGATRTSVVRTTPMTGGAGCGRSSQYTPVPITRTMRPSAMMRAVLALAIHLPPLDQKRGYHCEQEIYDREAPQPTPIASHLPKAGAQLIDANNAVDREIRREDVAHGVYRLGDRLAWPGKPRQKQLRQAGAEEDQRRGLRVLEPGARELTHEARRQDEQGAERE